MITGLLLAAGGARRFRSQKLVALFKGKPVVWYSASALASVTDSLAVVVGYDGARVGEALGGLNAMIVANPEWELGLATSLKKGVEAMPADCEAVVVCVGDQPEIDPFVVRAVIARWRETGQPIVTASYRGVRAHPVLFARPVFRELTELHGDAGARRLIERHAERVSTVEVDTPVPADVDTSGELEALNRRDVS